MSAKGLSDMKFIMDFQAQRHWNWKVAFYLYGAGTSAGLIFLEVVLRNADLIHETTALYGMWIGLGMSTGSLPCRESVRRLLQGEQNRCFWAGVVGIGLLLPSIIVALALGARLGSGSASTMIPVAACLALQAGGYLLRDSILRVGVYGEPL